MPLPVTDGVLFLECSALSSSGKCSDHSGELPDFEPDVPPTNTTATMCRVTRSLTRQGLGNHLEIHQDFE